MPINIVHLCSPFVTSAGAVKGNMLTTYGTRCSAIAERPHCRVRYSFRQKWKIGTGKQYFTDIIGPSSTTVILSEWKSIEFGEKNAK